MFKGRYLPFQTWPGSAQKVLRLAFHDSLRYDVGTNIIYTAQLFGSDVFQKSTLYLQDGTGGSDGCLNWEGVGYRYDTDSLSGQNSLPNFGPTNNNGLGETVRYLEMIYKNDYSYPLNEDR